MHLTKNTLPDGRLIDAGIREWLNNIADARGIRSRAKVMTDVILNHTRRGEDANWLSLACGAAQPIIESLSQLAVTGDVVPHATLVDLDRGALTLARGYALQKGLDAHVTTIRANTLAVEGFKHRTDPVGGCETAAWSERFDVVDAVGLLEYLRPEDWAYTYKRVVRSSRRLAGAVTFLRNAYACVKNGGILVVGNMLDTHPQLGFTLDVVQWPHIRPRSVPEVLDLFEAAGVMGHVDVLLPSDGVYAVYAIRKP